MSGRIFISYRHDDDATQTATGLYDWLSARFARNDVFLDDDRASPGIDYAAVIENNVGPSDVLVVVIGHRWLLAPGGEGRSRLDKPEDFVRLEIGIALRRGIPVIPAVADGASMPRSDELPEDLQSFAHRRAFAVSRERFRADSEQLARAVEQALESARAEQQRKRQEQEPIDAERRDREEKARLETERREREEEAPLPLQVPECAAAMWSEQPVVTAQNESRVPAAADPDSEATIVPAIAESANAAHGTAEVSAVPTEPAGASPPREPVERPARAPKPESSLLKFLKKGAANRKNSRRLLVVAGSGVAVLLLGLILLFNASRPQPNASRSQPVSAAERSRAASSPVVAPANSPAPAAVVREASPGPAASVSQVSVPSPTPSARDSLAEAERHLDAKEYAQARQWFQKAAEAGSADGMNGLGALYENGWGVTQDSAQARQWYRRAADAGSVAAKLKLAMLSPSPASQPLPNGTPSPVDELAAAKRYLDAKDYAKALPLLRKVADATRNLEALNQLGDLYYSGRGVSQDYVQARQWYQKAADAGSANAMYQLGELYQYGQGVARDYAQAHRWYHKAVDAGNADGMNGLGRLYENGRGVARDYIQARQSYQKAIDAGNVQGMVNLGTLYEGGAAQDYAQAREWYKKAADSGNTNGMYHLGLLYQFGLSVPRDYAQARQWYQKTVDGGNPQGMVNLGSMYEDGLGVPQDYGKAFESYQKAADNGHPGGMNGLARLYENGRGVPQDYAQARHWYQKAVDAGSVAAMEHLGNMYYYGHGVAQDHTKAREWYQKAVAGGWPVVLLPKD